MHFCKYEGAGNDFILIDDRASFFTPSLVPSLCHRQKGIGADGVILLQNSDIADFRMRIYNPDGSEASMCGNGLRCFVHFLDHLGFNHFPCRVETGHAVLTCHKVNDKIRVSLGSFQVHQLNLELEGRKMHVLNTGVPHAVLFVDDLQGIDVQGLGKEIRHHPQFAPHGVNVNFVSVQSPDTLKIRTYERGVEAETLACGTGSAAAAIAAHFIHNMPSSLKVITASGDQLEIHHTPEEVFLTGPVKKVFAGFF